MNGGTVPVRISAAREVNHMQRFIGGLYDINAFRVKISELTCFQFEHMVAEVLPITVPLYSPIHV